MPVKIKQPETHKKTRVIVKRKKSGERERNFKQIEAELAYKAIIE
jgi:hypothetical protein